MIIVISIWWPTLFCHQRLLSSFLNKLFTKKSFDSDFVLVADVDRIKGKNITMPDGIR